MHAHTPHTAHHPVSHPDYLVKIATAIDELNQQHHAALAMSHRTDEQRAARAVRLALNCARMAAWWGVLSGYLAHDPQMHRLHLRAAVSRKPTRRAMPGSGGRPLRTGRPAQSIAPPPTPRERCRTGTSWG